jgi:DNA-binding NarL/FixJ family response regulator
MIRAFVIAPTPMTQAGLRTLLAGSNIQIAGEAAHLSSETFQQPDIDVIVLADGSLLKDAGRAVANDSTPALVVLSASSERLIPLLHALGLRGWGIVPPDAPAELLQAAVTAASQGLVTLPAAQAGQLREQYAPAGVGFMAAEEQEEALTAREREVLELLGQGLPNKHIARRLQISEHTVKFHLASISNKLGVSSRTEAVSQGIRRGLITL